MSEENAVIEVPEETASAFRGAETISNVSRLIVINSPQMLDIAAADLRDIKTRARDLEAMRVSMTKPLDESKRRIMDLFRGPLSQLEAAEGNIKRAMVAYNTEQDRLRREEQARIDEAARKEREALEKKAAKAEASGKVERAEALREQAEFTQAPVVTTAPAAPKGINQRETWSCAPLDDAALIKLCSAIAARQVPPSAVLPNMTILNAQARSLKEHFAWPGCKAVKDIGISARVK
jgi:hypothetical protein